MYPRRTPVHEALESLSPEWGERYGMTVAVHFGDVDAEAERLKELALADMSALPRLGVKGPNAEAWLREHGVPAPAEIHDWEQLEEGGLVGRVDRMEFLVEDGLRGGPVSALSRELGVRAPDAYRVVRQDASFLIAGASSLKVLSQTCGVNFEACEGRFIQTRVALTSCSVLRMDPGGTPAYRLWLEPSYGVYLWGALLEIVRDLGGAPVGWTAIERA